MSMLMLARLVRLLALICTLLVAVGWILFAIDQTGAASKQTTEQIAGQRAQSTPDPTPDEEKARERINSRAREAIDDANDVLLRPFAGLVDGSGSDWVRRSVPALLGLLLYGVGLSMLARYMAMR